MADKYCKCKACKYTDPTERDKGYKWYCTRIRIRFGNAIVLKQQSD